MRQEGVGTSNMAVELKEDLSDLVSQMETNIEHRIARAVKNMPIMLWLKKVKGIGPRYSGSLVGMLGDKSFRTVSSLWAYVGMSVIPVCTECDRIAMIGEEKAKFLNRQLIGGGNSSA